MILTKSIKNPDFRKCMFCDKDGVFLVCGCKFNKCPLNSDDHNCETKTIILNDPIDFFEYCITHQFIFKCSEEHNTHCHDHCSDTEYYVDYIISYEKDNEVINETPFFLHRNSDNYDEDLLHEDLKGLFKEYKFNFTKNTCNILCNILCEKKN